MDRISYRSVLRSLFFLSARTRPDIATAVLAKFHSFLSLRRKKMKLVCHFLIGTKLYGIRFVLESHFTVLSAYTYADWACDLDKRRSRSGFALFQN